ncbi:hypothetical protein [Solibacillus sp. NPDC093137]|uniref:hypothetical protein n=1 Tax=Solibacillus sp. NPDC093137 TaxID=3390678 RepID=UPI003D00EDB4
MKKRIFITAICALVILGAFMGGRLYESKQNPTVTQEKNENIYTIKSILTEADFDIESTELSIRPDPLEGYKVDVKTEEERKIIIKELLDLKLIPSYMTYNFKEGSTIKLNLNQNFTIFVYEREKNIYFLDDSNGIHSYNIINSDKFFNILNSFTDLSN